MISFSCLLHFLLWHRGDSITGWHALLFRTPTKMRSLEGSSHDWLLCIRSSSHSKPIIMVHPYLSDCRDCSISCDNNLLEQSRKKQTLEMCCSPITYLAPFGWLILSRDQGDCNCVPEERRKVHAPVNYVAYYPDSQASGTEPHKYNFRREELSFLSISQCEIFQSNIAERACVAEWHQCPIKQSNQNQHQHLSLSESGKSGMLSRCQNSIF